MARATTKNITPQILNTNTEYKQQTTNQQLQHKKQNTFTILKQQSNTAKQNS
jgi:hypothetical protein